MTHQENHIILTINPFIAMEIKIKDADTQEGLIFTDDNLDNDNFITICAESNKKQRDFLLDDLFAALIAFDSKRSRRISREHPDL